MSLDWSALPTHPFGSDIRSADIQIALADTLGWEAIHRQLLLWSKQLPSLPDECRQERYQVKGCESKVWCVSRVQDGRLQLWADSDSRIVKGLLCVLLAAAHGTDKQDVSELVLRAHFDALGLHKYLSPSRANGLHAVIKTVTSRLEPHQSES